MKNKKLVWVLIMGTIITIGFIYRSQIRDYWDRDLIEHQIKSGELEKAAKTLLLQKDSLNLIILSKQSVIDSLENNPKIIIRRNDQSHIDINRLDAFNSIVLFTNNISKYERNRDRYNLHRFNKDN